MQGPERALALAKRDMPTVLPDCQTPRTRKRRETVVEKLEAMIAHETPDNDWQQHRALITGEEHELGRLAAPPPKLPVSWITLGLSIGSASLGLVTGHAPRQEAAHFVP